MLADERLYLVVDRSGGRSGYEHPAFTTLTSDENAVVQVKESTYDRLPDTVVALSVLGRWLAYRLVFRGGWTVHVDAPGRDPVKIRCRDRGTAIATALDLARRAHA